ncbi:MAG: hypothetical protein R3D51_19455 [Hyphomicrobiaceae bacterium]
MNLELQGVEDTGNIERERVVMKATKDVDIGGFAIFKGRKTSDNGVASGPVPAAFWLPDKKIKAGDFVVLYTKSGTTSEKVGTSGATSYFFYWGYKEPQWKGQMAVLVRTTSWEFTAV